jgi:hypothetical protein
LESRCLSYHLEHHEDDELAAKVHDGTEFTGYRISVAKVEVGEALVGIKVVSQKPRVYIGHPGAQWVGTEAEDWQERWRRTKDGWVFVERVSKPAGIIIIR